MSLQCEDDPKLFDFNNTSTKELLGMLTRFQRFYEPVHGLICVIICFFGILTNLIHVIVLTRPQMRVTAVNCLMTAVAICDMGTMASYLLYIYNFVLRKSRNDCENHFTFFWMAFLLVHMFMSICLHTTSLWLAVAMAFMRRMTLRVASLNSNWQRSQYAKRFAIVIFICVFVCSLPTLFVHEVIQMPYMWHPTGKCANAFPSNTSETIFTITIKKSALDHKCQKFKYNLWATGMLFKVIPCVLLMVLSCSLMMKLRDADRKRQQLLVSNSDNKRITSDRTTAMLLTILVVFIATEFPQGILALLNAVYTTDVHHYIYLTLGDVLDLLSLVNSSVNFVLYCLISSRYRHTFCQVILPVCLTSRLMPVKSQLTTQFYGNSECGVRVRAQNELPTGQTIVKKRSCPDYSRLDAATGHCTLSVAPQNYEQSFCRRVEK
uniref:G_PROTEIN_RECEP_F1_2 domain-containing protein n=1 Tax=Panagrellus redivivus TaxID=6233 RepID=A0A7E4UWH7_PANRE